MSTSLGLRYEEAVGEVLCELGFDLEASHELDHDHKVDRLIVGRYSKSLLRPVAIQITFQVNHEYKMRKFTVACPSDALGLYAEIHDPWPTAEETVHHLVQTMEAFIESEVKWLGLECRRGSCTTFDLRQRSNRMTSERRSARGHNSRLIATITRVERSYLTITTQEESSREFRAFLGDLSDRRIRDRMPTEDPEDDRSGELIGHKVSFLPDDQKREWPPRSGRRHLHAREVKLAFT